MTEFERNGNVLICDDLLVSVGGKWTASGIYVGDVVIPSDEILVQQLVLMFTAQASKESPWEHLSFQVLFPGDEEPKKLDVPQDNLPKPEQAGERRGVILRSPLLIQNQWLRPGKIRAGILDERGELALQTPWIIRRT
jgi:hypothetical protein